MKAESLSDFTVSIRTDSRWSCIYLRNENSIWNKNCVYVTARTKWECILNHGSDLFTSLS